MGLFGGGRQQSSRQSEPGSETVTLADPQLEGDPKQIVYVGLDTCGLSLIIHGPGPVAACYAELTRVAPAMRSAECKPGTAHVGVLSGRDGVLWTAIEGPAGSAIVVHGFSNCDTDFFNRHLALPLRNLSAPWRFNIGSRGRVCAAFADIFHTAEVVPLHALPGLQHLRRPDDVISMPSTLLGEMTADGWQQVETGLFRRAIPVDTGQVSGEMTVLIQCQPGSYGVICILSPDPGSDLAGRARALGAPFDVVVADDGGVVLGLGGPPSTAYPELRRMASHVAEEGCRLLAEQSTAGTATSPAPADGELSLDDYVATITPGRFAEVIGRAQSAAQQLRAGGVEPQLWRTREWRPNHQVGLVGWRIGDYLSYEFEDGGGDYLHTGTDETVWILGEHGELFAAILQKRQYHPSIYGSSWEFANWPAGLITELAPVATAEHVARMERGEIFDPHVHSGRRKGRGPQRFVSFGGFGDGMLALLDRLAPQPAPSAASVIPAAPAAHQPPVADRPAAPAGGPSLTRGGNVSLSDQAPGLTQVAIGLGWDTRSTSGADFDLDASAIATGADRRVLGDEYFVFFNNLRSPDGAIRHTGDNTTGAGDGDDELIEVDLGSVRADVTNIFFPVSIYDAEARGQTFGQLRNAYIRVVDRTTGRELTRYDLSEDASTETAMVFGELYRRGPEWKFRAVGQGYASGLAGIARDYGVDVE